MTRFAALMCLVLLASIGGAPALAQEGSVRDAVADGGPGSEVQQGLGTLGLRLSPGARVSVDESLEDSVVRLSFWHQEMPLGPQVAQAGVTSIRTFSSVPVSRTPSAST